MGGHQSPDSVTDTWLTPKFVLDVLGPFDLDPCAAPEPRPWLTAGMHYALPRDDGLVLPWFGRVWLNPPYGPPPVISPWIRKLADHGVGTAILFARTETEMFHRFVWEAATAALFLEGRLFFHRPDGSRGAHNAGAPSVLCAYGASDALMLECSGLKGKFILLRHFA